MFDSTTRSPRSPILVLTVLASVALHLACALGATQLSLTTPTRPLVQVAGTQVEAAVEDISIVTPARTTAEATVQRRGSTMVL